MVYEDRTLTCVECSQPFTFTADDQSYHAEKGYTNEPKRCPSCRQARRGQRYSDGGGGGGHGFFEPRHLFRAPNGFGRPIGRVVGRTEVAAFDHPNLQVLSPTPRAIGALSHRHLLRENFQALFEGELEHAAPFH